jgi:YidC/Oxa1 family membrane protein insertase
MERRVLIAIVLAFLVLYAYQTLFVRPVPQQESVTNRPTPAAASETPPGATTQPAPASTPSASSATPVVGRDVEEEVRVETPRVTAVFTNRGARLKSWKLKDYHDGQGRPLELVANDLGSAQPLPFTLTVSDAATTATLNTAMYAATRSPEGEHAPTDVTFEYRDSAGLFARKRFRLETTSYTVGFEVDVQQNDRMLVPTVQWGPGIGDKASQPTRSTVKPGGLFSVAGSVTRLSSSDLAKQPTYEHEPEYVGIDDHYFVVLALKPGPSKTTYQAVSIPATAGGDASARDLMAFSLQLAANRPMTLYIGPKDFDTLAALDRNYTKAINFGVFSVLVVPLLRSLNWIHGYVGNYGWAILLLTVFINVVLFPLNHKSVVSMRKMQEIQPEAKAIQDRYSKLKATDPARQKMNQELMALYRERGVNPASGCIPILLTLPVFIAFYSLLTTAIELRGAPFIGWIHDLSQPDPYYVLPVLVGISQIVTQWMTPQAGADPTQQKMMLIMPVVLIFVFIASPAGALIYWLVGNVWRLGQQYLTNYLIGPPAVRIARPAAERRVKRVGSGKTNGAAGAN